MVGPDLRHVRGQPDRGGRLTASGGHRVLRVPARAVAGPARLADDLVTALTQVVDGGDQLTEDELIGTVVLLLNAGHEATVNVTGIGWWQLFRHPDQLARLRREPGLLPRAVDELLRYDTLQMFERWVLEDVEIRGVAVPKGPSWGCCSARPTATRPSSRTPTASTWPARRPPSTSASGPACTTAWGRRWAGWSWSCRSGPCWPACPGWSRPPSRRGSRPTSCVAWRRSMSPF